MPTAECVCVFGVQTLTKYSLKKFTRKSELIVNGGGLAREEPHKTKTSRER